VIFPTEMGSGLGFKADHRRAIDRLIDF